MHAERNDDEDDRHEDEHEQEALGVAADETAEEVTAIGQRRRSRRDVAHHVLGDPAADDAVIRRDDERHGRREHANEGELGTKVPEGTDDGLARLATKRRFE